MQVKDIIKLKSDFGEYAFFNIEKLHSHPQANNAALIYFLFDELLQKNIKDAYINKNLNLDNMKEQDLFIFEFSTKNKDKKLLIKGLYLEDDKIFSLSCLKKFGQEEMHSADIKLYDENLSLDGYLIEQSTILNDQIIKNIDSKNKQQKKDQREEFRLKPRQIDDDIFQQPIRNTRPQPIPLNPGYLNPQTNIRPHIRWDPIFPPGIGPNLNHDPNDIFGINRNDPQQNPIFYQQNKTNIFQQGNMSNKNPSNIGPQNFFSQQRNNRNPF